MYSDFYEIPLPALRFEKVEETDTIKWKNDTEENDAFQIRPRQKAKIKRRSNKEKQIHSQETTCKEDLKTLPEQKHLL